MILEKPLPLFNASPNRFIPMTPRLQPIMGIISPDCFAIVNGAKLEPSVLEGNRARFLSSSTTGWNVLSSQRERSFHVYS